MENLILPCISICDIYMCHMFNNPESAQKILRPDLKNGNDHLGKLAIDRLDSSMMKKMAAYFKTKGKKPGST